MTKNDAYFMNLYKESQGLTSLVALCFSMASETYHHWRVFSHGTAGVCIHFDKTMLLEDLAKVDGCKADRVEYLKIGQAKDLRVVQLPFSKRWPYEPEREFRVIVGSKDKEFDVLPVPISVPSIKHITLSPWLAKELMPSARDAIRTAAGKEKIEVVRTSLITNERWKSFGDAAVIR
uniref:DUF2971 domain-containing protein n=2 Tax=Pandoraea norimbergensis TaxID=93219 RepID=A0ABM5WI81_9BURK